MSDTNSVAKFYSPAEEALNVASHALGFLLSIAATLALLLRAVSLDSTLHVISFGVFGASLMILYAVSTAYHHSRDDQQRRRLRVWDHASIYVLIAGTYTPFTLITLQGRIGWTLFAVTWLMAVAGIVLKLFFTGRFQRLSTFMYVAMGWLIVFAFNPLLQNFPDQGVFLMVAGGLAYTLGAVLYSIRQIPFNHALFHLLILVGSTCHFLAVYRYVV